MLICIKNGKNVNKCHVTETTYDWIVKSLNLNFFKEIMRFDFKHILIINTYIDWYWWGSYVEKPPSEKKITWRIWLFTSKGKNWRLTRQALIVHENTPKTNFSHQNSSVENNDFSCHFISNSLMLKGFVMLRISDIKKKIDQIPKC